MRELTTTELDQVSGGIDFGLGLEIVSMLAKVHYDQFATIVKVLGDPAMDVIHTKTKLGMIEGLMTSLGSKMGGLWTWFYNAT